TDPLQDRHPAVEPPDFAIVGASRLAARAHIGLALDAALEGHLLDLRTVVAQHHDTAGRRRFDLKGLGARAPRGNLRAWAILVAVRGGNAPTAYHPFALHAR